MEIKIKRNGVTPFLKKVEGLISSQMIADAAGEIGMADQIRTFQTSGANIGESWDPLAPLTKKWRKVPPLRKGDTKSKKKRKPRGRASGGTGKPLLSTSAIPFGMQKVMIRGGVSLRTNKVVNGVDIALVHDEGVDPYRITKKQRNWFIWNDVFLPKNKMMSIPQRKFSNFSRNAKAEMKDIPKDLKKALT